MPNLRRRRAGDLGAVVIETKVIDLSAEQPLVARAVRGKFHHKRDKSGRIVMRKPEDVLGITIHQTACVFGPAGDPVRKHRRALDVAAHVTAFQDGTVVQGHPLAAYVWHGNSLNGFTIGLECEGLFAGVRVPGHDQVSDQALASFCKGVEYIVERGRGEGMPINYIWAHRQSSSSRRGDPGGEIWQKVVIEYAVNALGLKTRVNEHFDTGRSIPKSWDASGSGEY